MFHTFRFIALAAAAAAVACGGSTDTTDDATEIEAALNQDFGGLTNEDTEPMFGDAATFEAVGEAEADPGEAPPAGDAVGSEANADVDASTDIAEDPSVPEAQRPVVYAIAISWGRQVVDTTAEGGTIWNPTLSTDCGMLAVKRLVKMEQNEGVVRPRTSPQTVSFRSATKPSHDGAILVLAIPQAELACTETGVLRFESEALDAPLEVPLDESMADLLLRHPLGDGNNVVAIGHKIEPPRADACVKGRAVGRWTNAIDENGEVRADLGRFYGRVVSPTGELRGHIKGLYGVPKEGRFAGKRVLFGKYIDTDGKFAGILAGRYGDGKTGGAWHLRPVFDPSALRGLFIGQYASAPDLVPDGGLFGLRYASLECLARPDEAPLE
jgi:hypothetical protein